MNRLTKTIITAAACLLSFGALTSCANEKPSKGPVWVNYEDEVKLNRDYKNRDFYQDGIGEVTLKTCIDGDTAHFNPVVTTTSKLTIKSRFYGIDTPESTGRIQPYGHAASEYTKERLKNAAANGTIVVTGASETYGVPTLDSTGSRYVSCIWINEEVKNCDYTELKLLNLMIVEYGYSWVKNVADLPSYADAFYAAEAQAKEFKLNMFSGEDDPDFPTEDFQVVTILDLKRETERLISDPTYESIYINAVKVCITGTVAGYSNNTLYLEDYYAEEDGGNVPGGVEYAGINCFCGMTSVSSKYTTVNTYLKLFGYAQYSENFGFQISGLEGHFPSVSSLRAEDDAEILLTAKENVDDHQLQYIQYTKSGLNAVTTSKDNAKKFECLNCAVEVTEELVCSSVYVNQTGDEFTLSFKGVSYEAYLTTIYKGDPERPTYAWSKEDFVGKTFKIKGVYTYHQYVSGGETKFTYQVVFNSTADLEYIKK